MRRNYERLIINDEESFESDSLESIGEQFDIKSNTIPTNPTKALIYKALKTGDFSLFSSEKLKEAQFKRLLIAYFKAYITERLVSNNRCRPLIPKILKFLKKNKLFIPFRLTAPLLDRIHRTGKYRLLNTLLSNRQIKFRMTLRTPKLLWKSNKYALIKFLNLSWDWSVLRPNREEHLLKGIDRTLFRKISKTNIVCFIRLSERSCFRHQKDKLIKWSVQENRVNLVKSLTPLIDI